MRISLSNNIITAEIDTAGAELKSVKKADKEYNDVVANHKSKMKRLSEELRSLEMDKQKEMKGSDKAKHDPGIKAKKDEIQATRNEIPDASERRKNAQDNYQKESDEFEVAQARYRKRKAELGIKKLEDDLDELDTAIKNLNDEADKYKTETDNLLAEIKKFQAITVAEAQRQWTIHVKVNLGGGT